MFEPIQYLIMNYYSNKSLRKSNIDDIEENNIKFVYYISSVSHLPSILKHGILPHNEALKKGLIEEDISDAGIQNRRCRKIVDSISIHNYVCLYFSPTNPMLFRVQKQYDDIIIIAVDSLILLNEFVLFSDGNASSDNTNFYSGTEFLKSLPWSKINAEYWSDPSAHSDHYSKDNLNENERKRIKCAEILVYPNVPPIYIKGVFCNSKKVMDTCKSISNEKFPILIDKRMFYS